MVKIEVLLPKAQAEDVTACLDKAHVDAITISEVLQHRPGGRQSVFYRGAHYLVDTQLIKLELLASSDRVDELTSTILAAMRTPASRDADGTILVYEVADAIRIRTGAHLQYTA